MNLPAWAAELLDDPVGHLATATAAGLPTVVPVCFVVEVEDDLAWSVIDEKPKSGRNLKRLRNITENPRFTLLVDRYDDDWSRLAWVQLVGSAEVVSAEGHPGAIGLLRSKYVQYQRMHIEESLLVRMAIDRAVSWRASQAQTP